MPSFNLGVPQPIYTSQSPSPKNIYIAYKDNLTGSPKVKECYNAFFYFRGPTTYIQAETI